MDYLVPLLVGVCKGGLPGCLPRTGHAPEALALEAALKEQLGCQPFQLK